MVYLNKGDSSANHSINWRIIFSLLEYWVRISAKIERLRENTSYTWIAQSSNPRTFLHLWRGRNEITNLLGIVPTLFNLIYVISTGVSQQFVIHKHSWRTKGRENGFGDGQLSLPLWFGSENIKTLTKMHMAEGVEAPNLTLDATTEQLIRVLYIGEDQNPKLHDPISINQDFRNAYFLLPAHHGSG